MSVVRGRVLDGRIEYDGPIPEGWSDGMEIETRLAVTSPIETWGMREDDWPTTPEGIASLLKEMESTEALSMTTDEIEAFDRAIMENRAWQKNQFDKWTTEAVESIR